MRDGIDINRLSDGMKSYYLEVWTHQGMGKTNSYQKWKAHRKHVRRLNGKRSKSP